MKIISRPKKEQKILSAVKKNAKAKEIIERVITQGEYCVDHLCGCS